MSITFDEDKQKKRLDDLYQEEAEQLAQALSQKYSLPYIDLSRFSINTDALKIIPETRARECTIAAFDLTGKKVQAAVLAPGNPKLQELLEELERAGYSLTLYIASKRSVERAWERYAEISSARNSEAGLIDVSDEHLSFFLERVKSIGDLKTYIEEALTGKAHGASKILEIVLAGAISIDSSDVHFEPEEDTVRLRFRLDGVLQDISEIKSTAYKLILSRIKLISGLKLNLRDSSQDGRYTIKIGGEEIEIRTSVIPGAYGESIVMRVLNPKSIAVPLEEMGIESHLLKVFEEELAKPSGLVLVTGPTGSGKTTTLYAFLRKVNQSGTKIITIEDPVEYHLKGISQTQVNEKSGYTFLEGLRSALRQDPDIIMVGEVRDRETAEIAINSALTGHLVFSTLHTNNAAGAIPRLIDLGVDSRILPSALTLTIAQRLIRKLCDQCKKSATPTIEEQSLIERILSSIPANSPVPRPTLGVLYHAQGCAACNGVGYKGRVGVYEAIKMDKAVEEMITKSPYEREIKKAASGQGILTLEQDGIIKVVSGITDIPELLRVIEIKDETAAASPEKT